MFLFCKAHVFALMLEVWYTNKMSSPQLLNPDSEATDFFCQMYCTQCENTNSRDMMTFVNPGGAIIFFKSLIKLKLITKEEIRSRWGERTRCGLWKMGCSWLSSKSPNYFTYSMHTSEKVRYFFPAMISEKNLQMQKRIFLRIKNSFQKSRNLNKFLPLTYIEVITAI